jgi:hypothetical protein
METKALVLTVIILSSLSSCNSDSISSDNNENIIIPISQPYSSYAYEINDEYSERVKQLFE